MFRFMKSPIGIAVGVAAVILASPKARKALRKLAVKTVSAFLGAKEQMQSAGAEMEEALPKVKEAAHKVAVKTVSPIIGAVEAVPTTISKFQEKWVSRLNAYHSKESMDYESLPVTP
ncbi:TPA: YtxH domain-containing protein [Bacillus cereus]|uniref:YtxH domain-containing protein n=1 Tax=Bacillus TaxID=1386 RepID=UPI00086457E7|nr:MULTISPECIES: YtxH domain-containing protein [Bacillus]MCP1178061.1 YtxH domain-containing protein [Bacillus sp. 1663tsa1]MCP1282404.1 YtxH domain-containing protein [Bacillus sp. S0635]MCQ6347955.1 YtxH domain-containing protein [Bacillus cereus]MCU5460921.1 YtxH domain-containing protein [Bacillus cereus]MCU5751152.1 YtxH domain-containing protein [Bacillus cereus]